MSAQLTLDQLDELPLCTCERHATCPVCDPDYEERDGDRAAGIVTEGPVPYDVIPY